MLSLSLRENESEGPFHYTQLRTLWYSVVPTLPDNKFTTQLPGLDYLDRFSCLYIISFLAEFDRRFHLREGEEGKFFSYTTRSHYEMPPALLWMLRLSCDHGSNKCTTTNLNSY